MMDRIRLNNVINDLLETLASIEHERWSHWQRYLHSKCVPIGVDGSLLIPGDLAKRWDKQMKTSYLDLSEDQKESDREQVRRYLSLIVTALHESTI
jgi:hypothetical protein